MVEYIKTAYSKNEDKVHHGVIMEIPTAVLLTGQFPQHREPKQFWILCSVLVKFAKIICHEMKVFQKLSCIKYSVLVEEVEGLKA